MLVAFSFAHTLAFYSHRVHNSSRYIQSYLGWWQAMAEETWLDKIRTLWRTGEIHGIELIFDISILALRYGSLSYWLKDRWLKKALDRWANFAKQDPKRRVWRDNLIDAYCILQTLALLIVLFGANRPILDSVVGGYIVFEIYLNLCSIFFLPRQRALGPRSASDPPSAVNEPSTSVGRSMLLLFVNVLQVVLAFAVFYKTATPTLRSASALLNAVLLLGTVGYPPAAEAPALLVCIQVFLDLFLIVFAVGGLVGQTNPFSARPQLGDPPAEATSAATAENGTSAK
jgi:hypothetical protein